MTWRRPGDKPLCEPMMVILLTHKCVTQSQLRERRVWFSIPHSRKSIPSFLLKFGVKQWSVRMFYTTASKHLQTLWNWPYVHSLENHHCSLKYFEQCIWWAAVLYTLYSHSWWLHSMGLRIAGHLWGEITGHRWILITLMGPLHEPFTIPLLLN